MARIRCSVPFCRATIAATSADEEAFCSKHYRLASKESRVEYDAAWHEAVKADRRAEDGIEPNPRVYQRVTAAWRRLETEVLDRALSDGGPA